VDLWTPLALSTGASVSVVSRDGQRHILAVGGGGWRRSGGPTALERYAATLSGAETPRICFLATASGDESLYIRDFYEAFVSSQEPEWRPSHVALFEQPSVPDVGAHLRAQDVIYVGGGSVANLLAVWRVHGLGEALREAWEAGVVLAGVSAGMLCWFVGGTTDSYGDDLRPVTDGLALLPYSSCPHYDSEERRRPTFHALIADGTLPDGYAADDGVALHFTGTQLTEAVRISEGSAYLVERRGDEAVETVITPRTLDA
jgi:peptidase E